MFIIGYNATNKMRLRGKVRGSLYVCRKAGTAAQQICNYAFNICGSVHHAL